jgi:paraquat-inducible protein A
LQKSEKKSLQAIYPKRIDVPLLIIISTLLLCTGLSLPLLNIQQMIFWKSEYSVFRGVIELTKHGDYVIAAIIFFFSVVFPIFKLLMMFIIWEFKLEQEKRKTFIHWLGILGKWSMLDVFVVAIIIVIIKIGPLAKTQAQSGLYFFTAAILLSLVTSMIVDSLASKTK